MTESENKTEQAMLDMANDFKEVVADKDKTIKKLTQTIIEIQCQRVEDIDSLDMIYSSTYAIAMSMCANLDQINNIANRCPTLLKSHCEDVVLDIQSRYEHELFKLRKTWIKIEKNTQRTPCDDINIEDDTDDLTMDFIAEQSETGF